MTLFRLECKTHAKSLLIWMIVVTLVTFGMMAMFPSMKESMSEFKNTMPQEMMEAFNISDMAALSTVGGYFGYVFQYIMIATGIFAAMLGTNSLAREEAEGTIEYLYAQPISRTSIIVSKMLSSFLLYTLYWIISVAVSLLICLIFKESGASISDLVTNFSLFAFAGWVMGLTFLSVGFLLSSMLSSNKSATSLSLGLVFLTYILGIVGKLQHDFRFLAYFSPIEAALPSKVFQDGIEGKYMLTDCLIILMACCLTFWIYRRKDLKV
ncbi:ABC transporter permease subunit [Terrilactibacillus sp. BCM23-1]|uniref:ABC transporter permease subunit n=1 Tax=Terrilactibacillus tamarindi TaxID=2599694 RepID=A0A6N8CM54_9BACI|nr:ABC transporter permease subunit [Terrilactibacillus tamarindi]MTT30678.1 ABC transporter permease subunit [Terrilactibacillus tamarindi]